MFKIVFRVLFLCLFYPDKTIEHSGYALEGTVQPFFDFVRLYTKGTGNVHLSCPINRFGFHHLQKLALNWQFSGKEMAFV